MDTFWTVLGSVGLIGYVLPIVILLTKKHLTKNKKNKISIVMFTCSVISICLLIPTFGYFQWWYLVVILVLFNVAGFAEGRVKPDPLEQLRTGIIRHSVKDVESAIAAGVDVNAQDDKGFTALGLAIQHAGVSTGEGPNERSYEILNLILDQDPDLTIKTDGGRDAADLAYFFGKNNLGDQLMKRMGMIRSDRMQ